MVVASLLKKLEGILYNLQFNAYTKFWEQSGRMQFLTELSV